LPGFCGVPEPKEPWSLREYSEYLNDFIQKNNIKPDAVLGYSFGGAVATYWKYSFHTDIKLILISPAIVRAYEKGMSVSWLKKILPTSINSILLDGYLKLKHNPYYVDGTPFLRRSYLNIVRIELSKELQTFDPRSVVLIFGSDDTATPPALLLHKIQDSKIKDRVIVLK